MNGREVRPEQAKYRYGGRLIVDKHPPFAAGRNFAPKNDRIAFRIDAVGIENLCHGFVCSLFRFKHACHERPFRPRANHVGRGFIPEEQREGINQNGFSRTSFAGQQIQPRSKLHRNIVNDGVILQPQFDQHG